MRYGIIGLGAIGGYYGGLLAKAGLDVSFLARSDYRVVKERGLVVESPDGDFHLSRVEVHDSPDAMPACDVAVVALKTTANSILPDVLPKVLKDGGIVVALQNGLGVESDAAEAAPNAGAVFGGLCFICSAKTGPGRICHQDYGRVVLGEFRPGYAPAGATAALERIVDDFSRAGIEVEPTGDLGVARWRKLVWNIPFNGLAVVLDATTEEILSDSHSRSLARTLMLETTAAARAAGFDVNDGFADQMISDTERMKPYKPSMKLDFEAGRPLELDAIYWRPIAAAETAGGAMPATKALASLLEFMSKHRHASE